MAFNEALLILSIVIIVLLLIAFILQSTVFYLLAITFIFITSAVYFSITATNLRKVSGYSNDSNLKASYNYFVAATVVSWFVVAAIIGIAGYALYYPGTVNTSTLIGVLLAGTLIITIVMGVLAALGTQRLTQSANFADAQSRGVYTDALISVIFPLVGGGLLLFIIGYRFFTSSGTTQPVIAQPATPQVTPQQNQQLAQQIQELLQGKPPIETPSTPPPSTLVEEAAQLTPEIETAAEVAPEALLLA